MQETVTPPTPLPPAAQAPYPPQPAPQPHIDIPVAAKEESATTPKVGALGITLIGGALAGAVGLLLAVPLLRRQKSGKRPAAKSSARRTGGRPRRTKQG
ncbi:hypothetical protein [Sphingomonas sp.]|uniref:hypothetical protein n=1 Tax=Sphingomonas sp. TaxID=28214 RepID=UPI003B3B8421